MSDTLDYTALHHRAQLAEAAEQRAANRVTELQAEVARLKAERDEWEASNEIHYNEKHQLRSVAASENARLRERLEEAERSLAGEAWTALWARVEAAERELAVVRKAAQEVWDSIPGTYDEDDPMVQRHAEALIALDRALLTEREEVGRG